MSDAFPNTIRTGAPWSSDMLPAGPNPVGMDTYRRRVNQDGPVTMADDAQPLLSPDSLSDLYAGLEAVPDASHSGGSDNVGHYVPLPGEEDVAPISGPPSSKRT